MADFRRGIKAGLVTGIIYVVIGGILGAIYSKFLFPPHSINAPPYFIYEFIYGTGLNWRALTDPLSVFELLYPYVVRGIAFGMFFAALYYYLPGTASVKKGVVLSAFVWILSAVGIIYTTPGWPTYGGSPWIYFGGGAVDLSSISSALAGVIFALVFGALTGFLWDRFRAKKLAEGEKGRPMLLVSFIFGGVIWVGWAVVFLIAMVIHGNTPIKPGTFSWTEILLMSVVFLGLPGWVLALVAWRRTRRGESGFKWGVAGGVAMALTGFMLLPGALAITGGVFSGGEPATESGTAVI